MAKKTRPSAKSAKKTKEEFILTIDSDSETEIAAPEEISESESESDDKEDDPKPEELNPDFQFATDDYVDAKATDGWNFAVDQESHKKRKEVDLDAILKTKGGLVESEVDEENASDKDLDENMAEGSEKGKDEPESHNGDESDLDESAGKASEEDEDELALDGFGMGADLAESSDSDEDEQIQEEDEESEIESSSDTEEVEEDSAEAMADFYEQKDDNAAIHEDFRSLDLSRPILKGLSALGYEKPSAIQSASIPIALLGKDIVAGAVTGSGKTAAYMIPIIERLLFKPTKTAATRVIVLAPTRELAIQVCDVGKKLGQYVHNLTFGLAVGGLNLRQQEQQLKSRPDIVVATPGRLIDHVRNSALFNLDMLEILVLDEADRMLEEGFQAEITEILELIPKHKRQTMLFSATMNTKIQDLIQLSLNKPVRIMIDPPKAAATKLVQEFVRVRDRDVMKPALLFNLLKSIDLTQQTRIVVFVARKETAHRLRIIMGLLGLKVSELHGSLSQEQRLVNVNDFKSLKVPILICTDLAARGLDIPKIELVINYDMPKSHEIYLHRVGRTARAGREGRSITFVGEAVSDRNIVKAALKSLESNKQAHQAVTRSVDWATITKLHDKVKQKEEVIEEVLDEEKSQKQLLAAEMEINKAENLIRHGNEIQLRPKRTWFESEKDKKEHKTGALAQLSKGKHSINSKKRKRQEALKEGGNSFRKTKATRAKTQNKPRNMKTGKKRR